MHMHESKLINEMDNLVRSRCCRILVEIVIFDAGKRWYRVLPAIYTGTCFASAGGHPKLAVISNSKRARQYV